MIFIFQLDYLVASGKNFFHFISIFIFLTRRKATEMLIYKASNFPDLLPKMPKYCCPVELFNFNFLVFMKI